jgi:hypothetical protein
VNVREMAVRIEGGSGSCSVAGFGISGVETSGSVTGKFCPVKLHKTGNFVCILYAEMD